MISGSHTRRRVYTVLTKPGTSSTVTRHRLRFIASAAEFNISAACFIPCSWVTDGSCSDAILSRFLRLASSRERQVTADSRPIQTAGSAMEMDVSLSMYVHRALFSLSPFSQASRKPSGSGTRAFDYHAFDYHCEECWAVLDPAKVLRCTKCKACRYCSRECQTKNWKLHKRVCSTDPVLRPFIRVEMAVERALTKQPKVRAPKDATYLPRV